MNVENRMDMLAPISGFPDFPPERQAAFDYVYDTVVKHYAKAGAVRIDTSAVQRVSALTAKGGGAVNNEIYKLGRLSDAEDGSAASQALRFDLTVPLALYIVRNEGQLPFPCRCMQAGRVYRGERAGSGRFREFYQVDLDFVGRDTLGLLADAELPAIINDIFEELKIGPFVIRINNRKILSGFFAHLGFDADQQKAALSVIDKADNGKAAAIASICEKLECDDSTASAIWDFINMAVDVHNPMASLGDYAHNEELEEGIAELCSVLEMALAFGVPAERLKADLSVARGLDYYTGTVYETNLVDRPNIGSICSGGRYDDLASHFTDKKFPGVGMSIGVSRLVQALVEAGILSTENAFKSHVLITQLDPELTKEYAKLATTLRREGIQTELYLESKGLGQQLKYATRKGYRYAIIMGGDEMREGKVQLKDLDMGNQVEIELSQLADRLIGFRQ